jgi:hypothetical protein
MKAYYLLIVSLLSFFSVSDIFSQKREPLVYNLTSDTIPVSVLLNNSLIQRARIDTLLYRQSICRTISIHNDLPQPALLQGVYGYGGEAYFVVENYVSGSLTLLPGEIVAVSKYCITHHPATDDKVDFSVGSNYLSVGNKTVSHVSAEFTTLLKRDSLLKLPCFVSSFDNLVFDPVIIDGTTTRQLTLKSNRNQPIVISASSTSIDANSFVFKSVFPVTVPPLGTVTVSLGYHPRSDTNTVLYRHGMTLKLSGLWDSSVCGNIEWTLAGTAIPPTASGIATPLFPDEKQILAFVGEMKPTVQTFHFTNNTSASLKIISVSMKNGTSFRINNVTPSNTFPFDLAAGANMTVDVEMFDVSQGVHYDELIIVVDKAADALHFELQGLQKEKPSSVRTSVQNDVKLLICPNPTSGAATFSLTGAERAELEISDVLGNIVYRSQFENMLIWNGSTLANNKLPSGSYIARVHSLDPSAPFVTSQFFIVQ